MKFSYKAIIVTSVLLICLPNVQAEPFSTSANIAFTSDYVFRGKTQTDENIAVQGGFDLNHESGFYLGTWGSNVNFLEDNSIIPEDRANIEIDVYAGFNGNLTNELNYDVKISHYMYPGANSDFDYDMTELNLALSYTMPQGTELGLAYDFSPDFAGLDAGHNYMLSVNQELPNNLGVGGYIGQQTIDKGEDYFYYGVSLSFAVIDLDASISYSNTDLDYAEDLGADGRVAFTLSKSF